MEGVACHAEALRLLDVIASRTTPRRDRLTARGRLELGLLPPAGGGGTGGIDALHAAAVASLGLLDNQEAAAFGERCLMALGELCREQECSERLGLIGGHQAMLRLMREGRGRRQVSVAAPPDRIGSGCGTDTAAEVPAVSDTPATARGSVLSEQSAAIGEEEQEGGGEEDEVQAAAAHVAATIVSSGCSFPMRGSFLAGEAGSSGLGRFPMQYDFVVATSNEAASITTSTAAPAAPAAPAAAPAAARGGFSSKDSVGTAASAEGSAITVTDTASGGDPPNGHHGGECISILVRPVNERQHSQFDVGFVMWPAAIILSRLLCRNPALVRGRRVLEIGAGLGLAGLVAARLQQTSAELTGGCGGSGGGGLTPSVSSVTLSDFNPVVLRALRRNVALNAGWGAVESTAAAAVAAAAESTAGAGDNGIEGGNVAGCGSSGQAGDGGRLRDVAVPAGGPAAVYVRHLDWDKLQGMPSGEVRRSSLPCGGGDGDDGTTQATGPQLTGVSAHERGCTNSERGDSDGDSDTGRSSASSSGSLQEQEESSGGGVTGIGPGERYDVIIASDHICQASDAEGTIRVLHWLLAGAKPAPSLPSSPPSPLPTSTTAGEAAAAAAAATASAQVLAPGVLSGGAAGGHAHFVVAHPRTRWGVDSLFPLLREAPGLGFTCEEVSDPDLVAGLEEASYLAWLHVHVWREDKAPSADVAADGTAANSAATSAAAASGGPRGASVRVDEDLEGEPVLVAG